MGSTPTLLVIFSTPYRLVLRQILDDHGFDVFPTKTPREAQDALDHLDPKIDLLITDFHFPDERGNPDFEAAAELCRLAQEKNRPDLPILILSDTPVNDPGVETARRSHRFPENAELVDVVTTSLSEVATVAQNAVKVPATSQVGAWGSGQK